MTDTRKPCDRGSCFLAHQWWGHDGRYCAEHGRCWLIACTPVAIATTAAA